MLHELLQDLGVFQTLLEARHAVIHDRMYGQSGGPPMMHPSRASRQLRAASSVEMYELANQLSTARGQAIRPRIYNLPRALRDWLQQNSMPHETF